jgi:mono/diheme cytochrome c family protein
MTTLVLPVLATSTVSTVGAVIAVFAVLVLVVYAIVNIRSGKAEVSSEVELAPNRKPYYDDEGLEGPRLNRALMSGLVLLGVSAIGLPLYWLNEPSRQDGAVATYEQVFIDRGAELFAPTAEGGYDCAGCHGPEGVGGVKEFTITDADNEFVATVKWKAPAINTVLLRYSEDELTDILNYGRPGTPMPAWGTVGGGPLTTQNISDLVAYIRTIQLTPAEANAEAEKELRKTLGLEDGQPIDYTDPKVGEALFNLGAKDGFASGAYNCARCHTKGAAFRYAEDNVIKEGKSLDDFVSTKDGSGAFGWALTSSVIPRQFLNLDQLIKFVHDGSQFGLLYGQRGQGTGRMPGFGDNPNTKDIPDDGMYTDGMLRAVACYEATLGDDVPPPGCKGAPLSTTTTLGLTATPVGGPALPSTTSTTNAEGN